MKIYIKVCKKFNIRVQNVRNHLYRLQQLNHPGVMASMRDTMPHLTRIHGSMVEKMVASSHNLEQTVLWSVSAKNAIQRIVEGSSPSQVVFGSGLYLLTSELPGLEPTNSTYGDIY